MNTYKITNITNLAGKRDFKFNSVIDIEYIDGISKKTVKVNPGDSIYLTVSSLPLSVHRLRVKNLITVSEVSATELAKSISNSAPKKVALTKEEIAEVDEATETKKYGKKKVVKKEEEE